MVNTRIEGHFKAMEKELTEVRQELAAMRELMTEVLEAFRHFRQATE